MAVSPNHIISHCQKMTFGKKLSNHFFPFFRIIKIFIYETQHFKLPLNAACYTSTQHFYSVLSRAVYPRVAKPLSKGNKMCT